MGTLEGIKITNSSIIIKVTLIKISPHTLEKLVLSDWSPVLQIGVSTLIIFDNLCAQITFYSCMT